MNVKVYKGSSDGITTLPLFGGRTSILLPRFLKKNNEVQIMRSSRKAIELSSLACEKIEKDIVDIQKSARVISEKFIQAIDDKGIYYKGYNLARVMRRDLDIFLIEYLSKIEKIKKFKNKNRHLTFFSDKQIKQLLNASGIDCRGSISLTITNIFSNFFYTSILKIKSLFVRNPIDSTIYKSANKKKQKNILLVGIETHKNNYFTKLATLLDKQNRVLFLNQFSKTEPRFKKTYIKSSLPVTHSKPLLFALNIEKKLQKIEYKEDPLITYLKKYLALLLFQNLSGIISFIDLLHHINSKYRIGSVVTGLPNDPFYNICIQFAKLEGAKSIFVQDIVLLEDYHDFVTSDYYITCSSISKNNMVKLGMDENKIFLNSEIGKIILNNKLMTTSSRASRKYLRSLFLNESYNLRDKKIIFLASEPANLFSNESIRYENEKAFLCTVKKYDGFVTLIKTHPDDHHPEISKKAIIDSGNTNAILISDADFYYCLHGCDIFVSTYSTAVLEAMMIEKKVLILNYFGHTFYKKAVDLGLATFINFGNEATFLKVLNKKFRKENRDHYLNKILCTEDHDVLSLGEIFNT